MNLFFFAPAKATEDSHLISAYLQTLGRMRMAEANAKTNSDWLRKLKAVEEQPTTDYIACMLTVPTGNTLNDSTNFSVGRGIYDIGSEALNRRIPTFLVWRPKNQSHWSFYPVIHFSTSEATGNWKLDYARAYVEQPLNGTNFHTYTLPPPPKLRDDPSADFEDIPF